MAMITKLEVGKSAKSKIVILQESTAVFQVSKQQGGSAHQAARRAHSTPRLNRQEVEVDLGECGAL